MYYFRWRGPGYIRKHKYNALPAVVIGGAVLVHCRWWHPNVVSTLHRDQQPITAGPPSKTLDCVHMRRRKGKCLARQALMGDVFVRPAPRWGWCTSGRRAVSMAHFYICWNKYNIFEK
mmetsp:Transcript_8981/g.18387  ORF Transcript_8981/g.18387 Transcript_8981/m.18387 type:complete len:118 (-) Transcript_8981:3-356(-)